MNTFAIFVISTFRLQEAATSEVSATEVFNTSDIDAFRCCVAEILDNLAGDKRLITLIISVLQQTLATRSYEKTYDLAGILMSYNYCNLLIVNVLQPISTTKPSVRLSDI